MGMAADIIAIGPFCPEVVEFLGYPPGHYKLTRVGSPVITQLFGLWHGSTASRDFARCLGISDPWDFNQHKLDPQKIDLEKLREFLMTLAEGETLLPDVDGLIAMMNHGFEFYFRPNG